MSSNERAENSESRTNNSAETQQKLSNEALALYQCGPGGPIVTNPKDCRELDRASVDLPALAIGPYKDPLPLDGKLPWPKPNPGNTGIVRT